MTTRPQWIESPLYDSLFFMAAPLLGALYLVAYHSAPALRIIPGVFFAVGMAHYLSTFSFYFGDDNRAEYRSHWIAFFVAPLLIIAAVALMRFGPLLSVLLTTIYLWNVWHITLQSCGILSVYRHLGGGPRDEKKYANGLLLTISAALVAANIKGFDPLRQLLVAVSPKLPAIVFGAALAALVVAIGAYVVRLVRRSRAGTPLRGSEAMFLGSSVLLFHPFAWNANAADATNGVLFGHFVQYLALVWLLHRRKYAPGAGSRMQNALAIVSRNAAMLGAILVTLAVAYYAAGKVMQRFGTYGIWVWSFNALVLIHFYLDGWIWAFKRPYVRQSLGPYLTPRVETTPQQPPLEVVAV